MAPALSKVFVTIGALQGATGFVSVPTTGFSPATKTASTSVQARTSQSARLPVYRGGVIMQQNRNPNQGGKGGSGQALSPLSQPNVNAIGSFVVGELILGGIAVLAAQWVGLNPGFWAEQLQHPQAAQWLTAATAAIPLVGLGPLTDRLPFFRGITRDTKLYTLALLGYKKDVPKALGIALLLSVAAGIGEELFFRGVLQTGFSGAYGPTWGLLLSSFLFGIGHTPFPAANAFVETLFGVSVGVLYAASGYNIAVPIITHIAYDTLTILRQHVEVTDTIQAVGGRLQAASKNQRADSPQVAQKIEQLKKSKNLPDDFVKLGRTIFNFLDLDNNGSITSSELRKGLETLNGQKPSEKEAAELVAAVDQDKDGSIDLAEFLTSAVNSIPQLPNPQGGKR